MSRVAPEKAGASFAGFAADPAADAAANKRKRDGCPGEMSCGDGAAATGAPAVAAVMPADHVELLLQQRAVTPIAGGGFHAFLSYVDEDRRKMRAMLGAFGTAAEAARAVDAAQRNLPPQLQPLHVPKPEEWTRTTPQAEREQDDDDDVDDGRSGSDDDWYSGDHHESSDEEAEAAPASPGGLGVSASDDAAKAHAAGAESGAAAAPASPRGPRLWGKPTPAASAPAAVNTRYRAAHGGRGMPPTWVKPAWAQSYAGWGKNWRKFVRFGGPEAYARAVAERAARGEASDGDEHDGDDAGLTPHATGAAAARAPAAQAPPATAKAVPTGCRTPRRRAETPAASMPPAAPLPAAAPSPSLPPVMPPGPLAAHAAKEASAPQPPQPPPNGDVAAVTAFLRSIAPPLRGLDAAVAAVPGSGLSMRHLRQLPRLTHSAMAAACFDLVAAKLRVDHTGDKVSLLAALDRLAA